MQIWPGGCQEELGDGNKEKDRKREKAAHIWRKEKSHTQSV